jgi:hypothetical protein
MSSEFDIWFTDSVFSSSLFFAERPDDAVDVGPRFALLHLEVLGTFRLVDTMRQGGYEIESAGELEARWLIGILVSFAFIFYISLALSLISLTRNSCSSMLYIRPAFLLDF